jgi:drug/metabolite transporter (DMT)-like permease
LVGAKRHPVVAPRPDAAFPYLLWMSSARSLLQIHVAVLLFGLAGLFGILLPLPPVLIVLGRVVFAALALLLASVVCRLPLGPGSGRSLGAFAALGVLLAAHWTTFFQSVQDASVAIALVTYSTFPVFVAFLEPLFFKEKLRGGDVLLALLALAGVVILLPSFDPGDRTTQGVLWGVASGLTFALLSLLNRKYVRHHSSITIALYQDTFAALALVPFAALRWVPLTARDLLLLLLLGVACTACAHSLFIAGLRGVKARTASMIACLEPVYGAVLATLPPIREVPTGRTLLGGLLVVGVAFYATVRPGSPAAQAQES